MKSKAILVSFVAIFAIAFALTMVAASHGGELVYDLSNIHIDEVEVNGVDLDPHGANILSGLVSETVPIIVEFTAMDDGDNHREELVDVRVKAYIEGFKTEISEQTSRFEVLEGNTYVKRFSLKLPSSLDLDELSSEELELLIRISARGEGSMEESYDIEVQKDLYSLQLLSIEKLEVVEVGERLAVDVVVENNGNERLDNVYLRVSIPALEMSRKVYVGDLESQRDRFDDDINDARERRVYLDIPRDAAPGNYDMEIEVYNHDTTTIATKRVVIRGIETKLLPPVTAKTIAPGKETTFDIILVNPSNRMVVYTVTPQESRGLFVEATEPIVTVPSDSSRSTMVKVRASESLEEGTYLVTVGANSETGMSEQVSFTVKVEKPSTSTTDDKTVVEGRPNTVVVLTVILVIIFVVLLIILIVLLTKRPEENEEFGETNYY